MGIYRSPDIEGLKNYSDWKEDAEINILVLHYTEETYRWSWEILTSEANEEVFASSHYLVREDAWLDSLVEEEKKAWHAGVSNWRGINDLNQYSIGIEIVNLGTKTTCFPLDKSPPSGDCTVHPFSEIQMYKVLELVTDIWSRHPKITNRNIIAHADIGFQAGRWIDPGPLFDWKLLAENGHGMWPRIDEAADLNPTTLYKLGDCHDQIMKLRKDLILYGYNVAETGNWCYTEDLGYAVRAFNFHFHQSKANDWGEWDSTAEKLLQDLLAQIKEGYFEVQ